MNAASIVAAAGGYIGGKDLVRTAVRKISRGIRKKKKTDGVGER